MKRTIPLFAALLLGTIAATAYIVEEGDTLWDISDAHLQDPFRWPDVWEINPHIVNPHLIYPGDSIRLPGDREAGIDSLSAISSRPYEADSSTAKMVKASKGPSNAGDDFDNRLGGLKARGEKPAAAKQDIYYIGGLNDTLPRSLNRFIQSTAPRLVKPWNDKRTFKREWFFDFEDSPRGLTLKDYDYAVLDAGTKDSVKAGDLLEFFQLPTEIVSIPSGDSAKVFRPYRIAAHGEVIYAAEHKSRVRILRAYDHVDPVKCRARLAELPPFLEVKGFKAVPSARRKDMAEIVHSFKEGQLNRNFDWIAVSRGLDDGFAPGNAVAIWETGYEKTKGLPPRLLGTGLVVYADRNTATVLIRNMSLATRLPDLKDKVSVTWRAVVGPAAD